MANDPIITPNSGETGGGGGGGSSVPSDGSIVPAMISTAPTDDFAFPGNVSVGKDIVGDQATTKFIPAADGTTAFQFTNAAGVSVTINVDSQDRRVGIGTASPSQMLHVAGNTNIDGCLAMGPSAPSSACLIDMINPYVGLGIPIMTSTQKAAISPNRKGNLVFDTDLGKVCVNNGSGWETITSV